MTKRTQIGRTVFTEQTIYFVAPIGEENKPFISTPNKEIFERQKEIAQQKLEDENKLKQIQIDFPNV